MTNYICMTVFFNSIEELNDYYTRNYGYNDFLVLSNNNGVQEIALF